MVRQLEAQDYEVNEKDRNVSLTEIGKRLFLSVKTVSTYRTRLLEKLGVENNADLLRYALRHGLTDS